MAWYRDRDAEELVLACAYAVREHEGQVAREPDPDRAARLGAGLAYLTEELWRAVRALPGPEAAAPPR